jgi:phosphatidate cytidylyltransferase
MLKHRLIFGTILAIAIGCVLILDVQLAPYYPVLLVCTLVLGIVATRELVVMLPEPGRPSLTLCWIGSLGVALSNWYPIVADQIGLPVPLDPWRSVAYTFVGFIILTIFWEMYTYREPGQSITRMSRALFVVGYIAILASFFIRLRWDLPAGISGIALTLTIFVPKCCDIGAYFTGRLFGRHPFTPILSPKKTWEGFLGGLFFATLTAVGLSYTADVFRNGLREAICFGMILGLFGVLGDLAESLIKRDCLTKDAAKTIPGFGGILDVIDSILFAGPVAYWWLTRV